MSRYLSASDSFNSSGATIVPDSDIRSTSTRTPRPARSAHPRIPASRALMPQDTLGRELEAVMGTDDPNGMANFEAAMQDYRRLPPETQSQTDMREFLAQSNPDFAAFLTNPTTNATEVLAQLQSQHLAEMEAKRNSEQANAQPNPFRPSSAHSHRGSVSGSDYSYATTEMDTDEAEHLEGDPQGHVNPNGLVDGNRNGGGMALQTGMTWDMGDMAVDHTYPTPGASNGGPSPPIITHASRIRGPISVIRGPGVDEEEARKRRLEHRRQINRKSAQKHRLRRKEETEVLTQTIIEKDQKIAQLEKDLAVEKSRTAQLQAFIDMQKGPSREREGRSERGRW